MNHRQAWVRETAALVRRCRSRTVAKTLSMGLWFLSASSVRREVVEGE